jgi:serine/threonine protein kinase
VISSRRDSTRDRERQVTCQLIEVIHTKSLFNESPINDVYIIHAPLAEGSFEDLRLSDHSYEIRLNAFAQVIRGVSHMHHKGVMHRDIKPTNLLFCGPDAQSVVADYGHSTRQKESKDHGKGTVAYLAPEVLRLKKDTSSKPYGLKADTWSLGVVGFELFFRPRGTYPNPDLSTETIHNLRLKMLKERTLSVAPALQNTLSWEAEDRPSMAEVASWSVWPTSLPESTVGRKRHDRP